MRKFLFGLSLITSAGLWISPAHAEVNVDWGVTITSGNAPPPVRYESMPPMRPNFVWVTGFWGFRNGGYVWVPGRWEPVRAGYVYAQPAWRQGPGGWEFQPGGWKNGKHHGGHEDGHEGGHKNKHKHKGDHGGGNGGGHDGCPPGQARKGAC